MSAEVGAAMEIDPGDSSKGPDMKHPPAILARSWWLLPLGIFLMTRVVDAALLVLLGRSQLDPSKLTPPGPGRPPLETGRSYAALVANWDGQWYRYTVEHGYPTHLPVIHGVVQENQWAFYPLYPALVRPVTWTGLPFGIAASLVSVTFGALAMCLLYRYLVGNMEPFGAAMTVLAMSICPVGVIWQAAYAESLALFLVVAALAALSARRYLWFLVAALALSLTRPIVLPLALVAAIHGYVRWRHRQVDPFPRQDRFQLVFVTFATVASFIIWPAAAAIATGRVDAFTATRRAWRSSDSHSPQVWFLDMLTGHIALLVLVPLSLLLLSRLLLRRAGRRWGLELRTWALVYPVYVLGTTTPTTSIFRYAALGIAPAWPIPEIGKFVRSTRERWALAGLVLIIGVGLQVVWMRWFFVISPVTLERP